MVQIVMTGNSAQAYAAKLARVQVVAAYPITPQTTIVEKLAEFVSSGELRAQYIKVESEHSAMQACISAAALGARTYTATSSQGLLLMHEMLFWASGQRAPVVMGVVNRAVAPPWSIWTDHTDTIAQRDTGWIQAYAETNQEVLDTVLMAYRIAEASDVRLPVMVCEDAFYLSHTLEAVDVPSEDAVDAFLPPSTSSDVLPLNGPNRLGSFMPPDLYMEFRYNLARGMDAARNAIREVEAEFSDRFGRTAGGLVSTYRCDDADAVLVTMGTATSTAREVVDGMRERGKRVGLAKLRYFRPFPADELRALAASVDRVGVLDRSFTMGHAGAAYTEVAAALQSAPTRPLLRDYVTGLGGREITTSLLERVYRDLLGGGPTAEVSWPGLKAPGEVQADG